MFLLQIANIYCETKLTRVTQNNTDILHSCILSQKSVNPEMFILFWVRSGVRGVSISCFSYYTFAMYVVSCIISLTIYALFSITLFY